MTDLSDEDRAIRILATLEASQRELSTIRATCERVLRINPDDTTAELVARLVYLAAPESAGKTWFLNWQRAVELLRSYDIEPPSIAPDSLREWQATRRAKADDDAGTGVTL